MTNIDSLDYEAGEALTTHKDIVQWMLDGGLVKGRGGSLVYGHDERGFYSASAGNREQSAGNFPGNVTWCKAILKRKAISWEDAVRAMLDGKHVWDKDGDEWKTGATGFVVLNNKDEFVGGFEFRASFAPFYLTQPPAVSDHALDAAPYMDGPRKPRRRVSREDAICAMVRNNGIHAWREDGKELRMGFGVHLQVKGTIMDHGEWCDATRPDSSYLYLDPPEAK